MTEEQFDKLHKPTKHRRTGATPNTSLWLDTMQRLWLKQTFGGIQPGIRELVEAAMTGTRPRLEKLRRQARRPPIDKGKTE